MVSYFSAGTQWATEDRRLRRPEQRLRQEGRRADRHGAGRRPDQRARRSARRPGKKAITIDQYQKQSDATAAVVSGKDDAMLADSPVVRVRGEADERRSSRCVGDIYDSAPYGYVLPKAQTDFGAAIAGAVQDLIDDGTYKKILTKWGVEAGAITTPAVNPTS